MSSARTPELKIHSIDNMLLSCFNLSQNKMWIFMKKVHCKSTDNLKSKMVIYIPGIISMFMAYEGDEFNKN